MNHTYTLLLTIFLALGISESNAQEPDDVLYTVSAVYDELFYPSIYNIKFGHTLGKLDSASEAYLSGTGDTAKIKSSYEYAGDRVKFSYREPLDNDTHFYGTDFTYAQTPPVNGQDTVHETYYYPGNGPFTSGVDSSVFYFLRYFSAGRLDSVYQYSTPDNLIRKRYIFYGADGLSDSIRVDRLTNGEFLTQLRANYTYNSDNEIEIVRESTSSDLMQTPIDYETTTWTARRDANTTTYTYTNTHIPAYVAEIAFVNPTTEVDSISFVERSPGEPDYIYNLYRSDDGADPLYRAYIGSGSGDMSLYEYWYRSLAVSVEEAPVWSGAVTMSNPIAAGSVVEFTDVPAGSRFRVLTAQGQHVHASAVATDGSYSWPALASGIYLLVVQAPNHQPRAYRLVSQ